MWAAVPSGPARSTKPQNKRATRLLGRLQRIFASVLHRTDRVPLCTLHERQLCKCGCRGSHTFQALWTKIASDFRIGAEGLGALEIFQASGPPPACRPFPLGKKNCTEIDPHGREGDRMNSRGRALAPQLSDAI
eukprot:8088081-Pyramimonas_sp.AAC.1